MNEEEKVCCEDAQEEELKEEQQAETSEEEKEAPKEAEEAPKEEVQPETEVIDYYDKWLRVTAEYQNYRNRTIKEKEEIYQNANAKFIEGLLEVIDNFERAM